MPGEATKRQRVDEDTDLGFLGHMTNQVDDEPEQSPEDWKRLETGPERSPVRPNGREQDKGKKRNQENRK